MGLRNKPRYDSVAAMLNIVSSSRMLVGVVTTLLAREPLVPEGTPQSLREAVVNPFVEYFARKGAWLILAFILLYKIGDTMASAMTTPVFLNVLN